MLIDLPTYSFTPVIPADINFVWSVYLIQDFNKGLTDPLNLPQLTKSPWATVSVVNGKIKIYPTDGQEKGKYRVIVAQTYPSYNNATQFTEFTLAVEIIPLPILSSLLNSAPTFSNFT